MTNIFTGPHSTRVATQPYQGLSIDFSFSGTTSADDDCRKDFEGLNKEIAWILITDHFTGMKHGDTRQSKASPIEWLRHFLNQYSPNCPDKYIHMDQGGELNNNPEVCNLFKHFNYNIFPTSADSLHQNGPVERAHRTVGDTVRALLTGANLDIKFWPYAFYHMLRISNSLPERGTDHQYSLLQANAKTSLAFVPLAAEFGSAHQAAALLSSKLTQEKESSLVSLNIPPAT